MYSLHRSARSRGLQAKGERELVPGLGRVSCGPSETLLSSGWNVCVCVSGVPSLSKWPKSSPFIVEGRTRTVHALTMRRRANRGGMSEPCGLFLWWRGRQSGSSLEHWGGVLVPSDHVRRESPGTASEWVRRWTCRPLWTDCARGRGLIGAEAAPQWGGLGGHEPQDSRDLGVQC